MSGPHRSNLLQLTGAIALIVGLLLLGPALPRFGSQISAQTAALVSEGADYATVVFGDPWDMSSIKDIYNEKTMGFASAEGNNRMAVQDGKLIGTSLNNDPYFWLVWPGFPDTQNLYPRFGINQPINADRYRYLVLRMRLDSTTPSDIGQIFWARDYHLAQWGISQTFALHAGWHTYVIDLKQIGRLAGNTDWNGEMQALRIDPTNRAGVTVEVDWVRLVAASDPSAYRLTWPQDSGAISLYATASQNFDKTFPIATSLQASQGSFIWQTSLPRPGDYRILRVHGYDHAGLYQTAPWDMADASRYELNQLTRLSGPQGVLRLQPTGSDPFIVLPIQPGQPIDANLFKRFTFQMAVSGLAERKFYTWQIYWRRAGGGLSSIPFQDTLQTGTQRYTVDLSAVAEWSGAIDYLRLDIASNTDMSSLILDLDWVSVSAGLLPASEQQLLPTAEFDPTPVRIQAAPRLRLQAPSLTSGADYATTVLGDPWDMDKASDIIMTTHIKELRVANSLLRYVTDGVAITSGSLISGDPSLVLRTGAYYLDPRTPIDPLRYRYLTYRFREYVRQDTSRGSVTRVLFGDNGAALPFHSTTRDTVVHEDWNSYTMDLRTILIHTGTPWTSYQAIDTLRLDPNEFPNVVEGDLDRVWLTAEPWADQSYEIRWSAVAGLPTARVRFYYDTDREPSVRTAIEGEATLQAGSFVWHTAQLAEGTYYVALEVDDGLNPPWLVYGDLPVRVKRQATVSFGAFHRQVTNVQDFAHKAGNSWDFSGLDDLDTRGAPFPAVGYAHLSHVTIRDGALWARTTDTDSYLLLNMPGGARIDTLQYKKLTLRIYSGRAEGPIDAQLIWYTDTHIGSSEPIRIYPGWGTYTLDLANDSEWTGNINYLRLDPAAQSGVDFAVDEIRLVPHAVQRISWTPRHFTPNTRLSLYAQPQAAPTQLHLIAQHVTGNSLDWDYSGLDDGIYHLIALVDDRISDMSRVTDPERFYILSAETPELHVASNVNVLTGRNMVLAYGLPVFNRGGALMNWTASSSEPWLRLLTTSGTALADSRIDFLVDTSSLSLGSHTVRITVDAGTAGIQIVTVTVNVVEQLRQIFMPATIR